MRSFLACVVFVAVFANMQAAPTDNSAYNAEELLKKTADHFDEYSKKISENTGMQTNFDKEKFLKYCKEFLGKVAETQKSIKEHIDSGFKNLPGVEDLKKKLDDLHKQILDQMKLLNTPEVQKAQEKVKDAMKKFHETLLDYGKVVGVAPPPSMVKASNEIGEEFLKAFKVLQEKSIKLMEEFQKELVKKKA